MAAAYRLIDGDSQSLVPDIKPLDPRRLIFDQLKSEYKLQELISEAKTQGISRATVIRWNDAWQEQGQVRKIEYGHYRKVI
jgi:Fe2+ or Zn2+ uptake regulation protein